MRLRVAVASYWIVLVSGIALAITGTGIVTSSGSSGMELAQGPAFVALGLAGLIWGGRRAAASRRTLHTDVVLRLDDEGVAARMGTVRDDLWARLAWADVAAVEVRPWTLEPPLYRAGMAAKVLRFVATDDDAIRLDGVTWFDRSKGASLELSPAAAALAQVLVSATGLQRIDRVRDWLAAHRPEVPFKTAL